MTVPHLVLTGGPSHEFGVTSAVLVEALADAGFESTVVAEPATAVAALADAAAGRGPDYGLFTVFALHWRMEQAAYADRRDACGFALSDGDAAVLHDFVAGGRGLLALHAAVICFDGHPVWRELCGAVWDWERSSHPAVGAVAVTATAAGRGHEVTSGVGDFVVEDEVYEGLDAVGDLEPLLVTGDRSPTPLLWARSVGAGRVVTDVLGHGRRSLETPAHREILRRAARWAAGVSATGGERR